MPSIKITNDYNSLYELRINNDCLYLCLVVEYLVKLTFFLSKIVSLNIVKDGREAGLRFFFSLNFVQLLLANAIPPGLLCNL